MRAAWTRGPRRLAAPRHARRHARRARAPFPRPPYPLLGRRRSYVLTQFQSHTLNSHIAASYPPMKFGAPDQQAWVDVLAAQQTVTEREW